MTRSVRALAVLVFLATACAAPTPASAPAIQPTVEPTAAPTAAPSAEPTAAATAPSPAPPKLADPVIAWDPDAVPIVRTGLREPPIDDQVKARVRDSVTRYLKRLDEYRNGHAWAFPVSGAFGAAVKEGLDASATPGVTRRFELSDLVVERYVVKPWGVPALADVRVTIVDKVALGEGPDQAETGRLRLLGDRLDVVDGWDMANGKWSNGLALVTERELRMDVSNAVAWYLRTETWLPGSPVETGFGPATSAFWAARHSYLTAFDRSKVVSRTFADLRGRIERYETFPELKDGLATVLVTGTVVTVDAAGTEQRSGVSRRLIVLVGNWIPQVADEEIAPGTWRSGSQAAFYAGLRETDRNAA